MRSRVSRQGYDALRACRRKARGEEARLLSGGFSAVDSRSKYWILPWQD
jgi:hypothetical protein